MTPTILLSALHEKMHTIATSEVGDFMVGLERNGEVCCARFCQLDVHYTRFLWDALQRIRMKIQYRSGWRVADELRFQVRRYKALVDNLDR